MPCVKNLTRVVSMHGLIMQLTPVLATLKVMADATVNTHDLLLTCNYLEALWRIQGVEGAAAPPPSHLVFFSPHHYLCEN